MIFNNKKIILVFFILFFVSFTSDHSLQAQAPVGGGPVYLEIIAVPGAGGDGKQEYFYFLITSISILALSVFFAMEGSYTRSYAAKLYAETIRYNKKDEKNGDYDIDYSFNDKNSSKFIITLYVPVIFIIILSYILCSEYKYPKDIFCIMIPYIANYELEISFSITAVAIVCWIGAIYRFSLSILLFKTVHSQQNLKDMPRVSFSLPGLLISILGIAGSIASLISVFRE